jgi:hypothetical protein
MKNISSSAELKEAICLLEIKKANELELLKSEVHIVLDKLKPENLIKNSIQHGLQSGHIKENLIDSLLSLAIGYVSKKLLLSGGDNNPLKNMLGSLIQVGVTGLASKNSDEIKSAGLGLLKNLFSKK